MEQFLDMSFRDLFEQYNNLLEALNRSYDRLQTMIDIVFPACVLRIESKFGRIMYIMTEAFYEIHYLKIIDEYKLYYTIDKQLSTIWEIHHMFEKHNIIKYDEYILQERDYQKRVRIIISGKGYIEICFSNDSFRIKISDEIYNETKLRLY